MFSLFFSRSSYWSREATLSVSGFCASTERLQQSSGNQYQESLFSLPVQMHIFETLFIFQFLLQGFQRWIPLLSNTELITLFETETSQLELGCGDSQTSVSTHEATFLHVDPAQTTGRQRFTAIRIITVLLSAEQQYEVL